MLKAIERMIRREGPITFDRFMDAALYDPEGGFFATGRGAGRAGRDFVTSPEVGPLFGACVARAIDVLWRALDEPDPFLVVEAGAGTGRLAADVLRARPECERALRYVLVERSSVLRAQQREQLALEPADEALGPFTRRPGEDQPIPASGVGPVAAALDELPAVGRDGLVLANELLDNLPFGIVHWDGGQWLEVRVTLDPHDRLVELLVPAVEALDPPHGALPTGTRIPIPRGITEWLRACEAVVHRGYVLLVDYMMSVDDAPARPWLRTYRGHGRAAAPLDEPGTCDITADVVIEQLLHAARAAGFVLLDDRSQADWLRALGVDGLVEDARRGWRARAHVGDLEALASRSRVTEAAALTDPTGLGAHRVVLLGRRVAGNGFSWSG